MKVLYLTPGCFDKGGISRYSRYQIAALREIYGKENVVVFSLLGKEPDSIEEEINVQWTGNGPDIKSKLLFAKQTISRAISWKPDLIFCAHVNLSGLACVAAKLCKARTVLNVYGLEVRMKLSFDAAWGLKKSERVISDCYATAEHLFAEKLKEPANVVVIWDCISLDKFKPVKQVDAQVLSKYNIPDPSDHFIVLTLGRLSLPDALYKGYDRLMKVMTDLFPRYTKTVLVIAGRGNYRTELERMAKELKVEEKVKFTGSIDE
ncbi:MAG TPA: glycosyltransferase family 4 protein, partial [Acidobacteriota bacterium]